MALEVVRHQLLVELAAGEHAGDVGPRPNQRHITANDIPKLRKLVETRTPQQSAERRDPRIALTRLRRAARIRCLDEHRAEFPDLKGPSREPIASLTESTRARSTSTSSRSRSIKPGARANSSRLPPQGQSRASGAAHAGSWTVRGNGGAIWDGRAAAGRGLRADRTAIRADWPVRRAVAIYRVTTIEAKTVAFATLTSSPLRDRVLDRVPRDA